MNAQDELREIWNSQPPSCTAKREDIVALVQKRIRRFDRTVRMRNLRECVAGGVVFVLFVWFGLRAQDATTRTGEFIIAASAVWIIFYLVRYGKSPTKVDPDQNLMSYTHALVERYDHQIHLQRTVKYWYLLPAYVGLLTMSAGLFLERLKTGSLSWWDVANPIFSTAFFGAIWWLNEVVVVRRLRQSRSNALEMTKQNEITEEEQ